jgi:hypothetical protein
MDMNWTYDISANDTISLVEKRVLTRKGRYRKTFIILPSTREPSPPPPTPTTTPTDKKEYKSWSMLEEINKQIAFGDAIYQVNRYPKLKLFFPELVKNNDLSFNQI